MNILTTSCHYCGSANCAEDDWNGGIIYCLDCDRAQPPFRPAPPSLWHSLLILIGLRRAEA